MKRLFLFFCVTMLTGCSFLKSNLWFEKDVVEGAEKILQDEDKALDQKAAKQKAQKEVTKPGPKVTVLPKS